MDPAFLFQAVEMDSYSGHSVINARRGLVQVEQLRAVVERREASASREEEIQALSDLHQLFEAAISRGSTWGTLTRRRELAHVVRTFLAV